MEPEEQPPVLSDVLERLVLAQGQLNLYGEEHTLAVESVQALACTIGKFVSCFDLPTCEFTGKTVSVNGQLFSGSPASRILYERLRIRGAAAIALLEVPCIEQLTEFLRFMNVEPRVVREQGGPRAYLSARGVCQIAVTELAGPTSRGAPPSDAEPCQHESGVEFPDAGIGAAVDQRSGLDEDGDSMPVGTGNESLSSPEELAALVTAQLMECQATDAESALEAIQHLKGLYVSNTERWDDALPEIRNAVAGMPEHARKLSPTSGLDDHAASIGRDADASEVEAKVARMAEEQSGFPPEAIPGFAYFEELFGAKPCGLLSSWQAELRPGSMLEACGRTLSMLMIRESRAAEHERLVRAIVQLIARALDMKEMDSATLFIQSVMDEMKREGQQHWRSANARNALASLDAAGVKELVESAANNSDYRAREVAAALVENLPHLALSLAGLLGVHSGEPFDETLKAGIAKCGSAGLELFAKCVREGGYAAKLSALAGLIEVAGPSGLQKVADLLADMDDAVAITALRLLGGTRSPLAAEICCEALSHASSEVRCAALGALGDLGDQSAVPRIIRFATRRAYFRDVTAERMAAIQALGRIGGTAVLPTLESIAGSWVLIGRGRHRQVRAAANEAIQRVNARLDSAQGKAA